MTGEHAPEGSRLLGPSAGDAAPTPAESERARRTIEALERLRRQLARTQDVLDDYLERLDAHAGDARSTTGG